MIRTNRYITILVISHLFVSVPAAECQESRQNSPGSNSTENINAGRKSTLQCKKLSTAKDVGEVNKIYKEIFKGVSRRELMKMRQDQQTGIALYAFCKSFQLDRGRPTAVARSNFERFFGFLEGRTGLVCPDFWAASFVLRHADVESVDFRNAEARYLAFDFLKLENEALGLSADDPGILCIHRASEQETFKSERGPKLPKNTRILNHHIMVDRDSIPIHASFRRLLESEDPETSLRLVIDEDFAFAAIYDDEPTTFPLVRLDRKTGQVLWQKSVRAEEPQHKHGPNLRRLGGCSPPQDVWIVQSSGIVAVFGATSWSHYLEVFNSDDGQNDFRFLFPKGE